RPVSAVAPRFSSLPRFLRAAGHTAKRDPVGLEPHLKAWQSAPAFEGCTLESPAACRSRPKLPRRTIETSADRPGAAIPRAGAAVPEAASSGRCAAFASVRAA